MARCILVSKNVDIAPNGQDLAVFLRLMFAGADVNPPDFFDVTFTAPDTMTKTQFQTKIRNQVQAEATRTGRTWNGNIVVLEALLADI